MLELLVDTVKLVGLWRLLFVKLVGRRGRNVLGCVLKGL